MTQANRFYALTPEISQKLLAGKFTAAQWRLWVYLVNLDPFGDRYRDLPDTLEIMQALDMSKSTFYAAIAKFQKLELFDFQDKGFAFRTLVHRPKNRNSVQKIGQLSEKSDNFPKNRTTFRKIGQLSEKLENQPPEVPPDKGSGTSQNIQNIQTNKTLSEAREREFDVCLNEIPEVNREKFLSFARTKAAALPNPPQLVNKWIAVNFGWILEEFKKAYPQNLPTVEGKGSAGAHPQKKNEYTIDELKHMYPNSWRNAVAHFGINEDK